jgi:DNA-binding GntR family transcriptional regulator
MSEADEVRVVIEAMAMINAMGALSEERRQWIEKHHWDERCNECGNWTPPHTADCSVPRLIQVTEPHTTP